MQVTITGNATARVVKAADKAAAAQAAQQQAAPHPVADAEAGLIARRVPEPGQAPDEDAQ